jgi:broad specificity phosphatase PhoE
MESEPAVHRPCRHPADGAGRASGPRPGHSFIWASVLAGAGQPPAAGAVPEPDLVEWDYGQYEGRRAAEVQAERPGWSLFDDGCPGGESLQDLSTRADRLVAELRKLPGDQLLVAHRDILRILIARWTGQPAIEARNLLLDTASLSILGYQHALDEPAIRLLNASAENVLVAPVPAVPNT